MPKPTKHTGFKLLSLLFVSTLFLLANANLALAEGPIVRKQVKIDDGWRQSLSVRYVSQLSEPAPAYWTSPGTPYCAAAAASVVLSYFGVSLPPAPLRTLFALGRSGNTSSDLGLDPDGISLVMRTYGGEGHIHIHADPKRALADIVGRLNYGSPVIALTQGGNHAVTVYGYEADLGGSTSAILVEDPLSGFVGKVSISTWLSSYTWMGQPFIAPGPKWQGTYVFITYRDFAEALPAPAPVVAVPVAPAPAAPVISATLHSKWVSQSSDLTVLKTNGAGQVSFTLRNTGSATWVKGGATEIRLGVVNDATTFVGNIGSNWPLPSRVAVQNQPSVGPGEIATFNLNLWGFTPGTYKLPLRPVIDGVAWLEDEGIFTTVIVTP